MERNIENGFYGQRVYVLLMSRLVIYTFGNNGLFY